MTNTTVEDDEDYKRYIARREKPLAELRARNALVIDNYKSVWNSVLYDHCCIGISPRDSVLDKFTRGEISDLIKIVFKRTRALSLFVPKGLTKASTPTPPPTTLSLALVGEYSNKHRWHYHGLIKVPSIVMLTNVKKRLQKYVGRTVTEQTRNVPQYIDYMFKQYVCDEHGSFYDFDKHECVVEIIKVIE